MNRYKPVGWRNESYRHSLAARGLTRRFSFMPLYIYRKSTGGKHKGNELDNDTRRIYGDKPLDHINVVDKEVPIERYGQNQNLDGLMEAAYLGKIESEDKEGDIQEVRMTDRDDLMLMHLKRNKKTGRLEDVKEEEILDE